MWFFLALVTMFAWGLADIFYKKSSDENDGDSHLKITVWVGLVMGVCAFVLMPFTESDFSAGTLASSAVKYAPASLAYIISMVIGYAGMRYLEISIVSPVQNASGALAAVSMIIYFTVTGKTSGISDYFSALDLVGTALIAIGVILLAVVEKNISEEENKESKKENGRFRTGALALIFPIAYCIFDTAGTAADGIILDENTGLGLGEIDVLVLFGLTFLLAGVISWIVLLIKRKKAYNPFKICEIKTKGTAALFEECGQIFYVYAMAAKPVAAAPMTACYCIVSVILSAIILKEKLQKSQYLCIASVIAGIVLLGISEGLSA